MFRLTSEEMLKGIDILLEKKDLEIGACINAIYEDLDGYAAAEKFHAKHMTPSCEVITISDRQQVKNILSQIKKDIEGKIIVEIGAGVGLLALGMATIAKEVYAIESDPAWSWAFTKILYGIKQPNLTFIFGKAETMIGKLKVDVAIIVTRSGHAELQSIGRQLANKVIDVYEQNK